MKKVLFYILMIALLSFSVFASNFPTSYNIESGIYRSGDLSDTNLINGNYLIIDESSTTPGYDIRFTFTDVTEFEKLQQVFRYDGGAGNHIVQIQLYNFNISNWTTISEYDKSGLKLNYADYVPQSSRFINDSTVLMRHYHASGGHSSHYLEIDYISLDTELSLEEEETESLSWYMIVILLFFIIFALYSKQSVIGILSGIGLLFVSFNFIYDNTAIGIVTLCSSLIIMLYFLLVE